jgi:hypothetical protein
MCEMLKSNPELRVIIVTPVKTDLPTGLVGEIFDWSQDHSTILLCSTFPPDQFPDANF